MLIRIDNLVFSENAKEVSAYAYNACLNRYIIVNNNTYTEEYEEIFK